MRNRSLLWLWESFSPSTPPNWQRVCGYLWVVSQGEPSFHPNRITTNIRGEYGGSKNQSQRNIRWDGILVRISGCRPPSSKGVRQGDIGSHQWGCIYFKHLFFEHSKEQILFLYPNLDFWQINFLKVLCGGQLMDEETLASSKLESPTLIENTQEKDRTKNGGESGLPQPENDIKKEITHEEYWWFGYFLDPNGFVFLFPSRSFWLYLFAPSGACIIVTKQWCPLEEPFILANFVILFYNYPCVINLLAFG